MPNPNPHEVSEALVGSTIPRTLTSPTDLALSQETPAPLEDLSDPSLSLPEAIDVFNIVQKIQARANDVIKLIGGQSYERFLRAIALYENSLEKGYDEEALADIQELVVIQIKNVLTLIVTAEYRQRAERRANVARRKAEQLKIVNEALGRQTKTDPLTELYNQRGIEERGKIIFELCREKKIPLSCLYIDIDYFKLINDLYGHDVGNIVLKRVAEILTSEIRGSDLAFSEDPEKPLVGRDGGEEFLVLMPFTDLDDAATAAERIRERIQHERINVVKITDGKNQTISIDITCTIGVVQVDFQRDTSVKEVKPLADTAMRLGKEEHRNIVSVAKFDPTGHGRSFDYPFVDNPNRKVIQKISRYGEKPEKAAPPEEE